MVVASMKLYLFALACAFGAQLPHQGGHVRPPAGTARQWPLAADWALENLAKLDTTRLKPIVNGSWEHTIAVAGRKTVEEYIQPKLGSPSWFYTIKDPKGDVLVARWAGWDQNTEAAWLWDDMYFTRLVVDVKRSLFEDPLALQRYCEGLFEWTHSGFVALPLTRIELNDGRQWIAGLFESNHMHQLRVVFEFLFTGVRESDGKARLILAINKFGNTYFYPPEGTFIPERFPPLSARVQGYSKEQLLQELDGPCGMPPPCLRQVIALGELISRDSLTEGEVAGRLERDAPLANTMGKGFVWTQFRMFWEALGRRGNVAHGGAVLRALLSANISETMRDAYAVQLFLLLKKNHVDVAALAYEFINANRCVRAAVGYLESPEAWNGRVAALNSIVQ